MKIRLVEADPFHADEANFRFSHSFGNMPRRTRRWLTYFPYSWIFRKSGTLHLDASAQTKGL
jgi:hypothetical protein